MAARALFKYLHARRLPRDKRQRARLNWGHGNILTEEQPRDQTSCNLSPLLLLYMDFLRNISTSECINYISFLICIFFKI
jgi:hypothetical protein